MRCIMPFQWDAATKGDFSYTSQQHTNKCVHVAHVKIVFAAAECPVRSISSNIHFVNGCKWAYIKKDYECCLAKITALIKAQFRVH